MSMQDYEKAIKLIEQHPEKSKFIGPQSEQAVELAERALEIAFPITYRRFLLELGAGSYGSTEIYGVINDHFSKSGPDVVEYTLEARRRIGLPKNYLEIYALGYGEIYHLDLALCKNKEAPVISFGPGYSENQYREIIAEDFGSFLLEAIREEMNFSRGRTE